ncbi:MULTISPECIES: EscU/YscU/HrcU family type III secretion system export apparatus switch protein [Thiomicrorhabdus]|uniref:Flagellar biosynthetic protein FlhB n=1 Tax=Thiomicrorhabdus heinhorstiae TaxID=2748010 RepID=A0ABS0BZS4_9GAMM|nr:MULTISPECIES: EscU/YscU/HrcU family type III secretion system export apparatus switch protein [Thiomicrorhabdus]MBF6058356.1 EscU/YscU/HrcU family type III secretion system export apparatus switch protein [Thiomicrorhabdus heinhorstiae]
MKPPSKHNLADKVAVSLAYEGTGAPKVTAKGRGHLAEEILKTAREHNIPIQEDEGLVSLLSQVELDQEIPTELYEAIAQLLIFVYQLSGKTIPRP